MREDEIHDILKACHDGPYGVHFADKGTRYKVFLVGYFWPTLFQDDEKYVQGCDSFQRMGQSNKLDEIPL